MPIGRPIANTRVYVLDRGSSRCRSASPASLYVGGDGLARGYLGRPDLTAERFVPDPFGGAEPGARLYRTGDLGALAARRRRSSSSGALDTRSRCAASASSRARSRRRWRAHPGVREAAVVAREDGRGASGWWPTWCRPAARRRRRRSCAAFLRRAPARTTWCPRLRARCRALPLTANGKVDRRALPAAPEPERPDGPRARARRAPRSRSCWPAIWAERPGAASASASTTNFFDLGGHSLLATQVVSRIRERLRRRAAAARACSRRRRWPALAARVELARGARQGRPAAPPLAPAPRQLPGASRCRCRSPSSGSGSSTSSSPGSRPTTCRCALRLAGRSTSAPWPRPRRDRAPPRGPAHHLRVAGRRARCR